MKGREGGKRGVSQEVISLRILAGHYRAHSLHWVGQEHPDAKTRPAHTLAPSILPSVKAIQEIRWWDGYSTSATVHRGHTEPLCKFKECLSEKGSPMSRDLGRISVPCHPLSQAPSRTAESALPYRADWAVGWNSKPCLKNIKHKWWTRIFVVCSVAFPDFFGQCYLHSSCETVLPHSVRVWEVYRSQCPALQTTHWQVTWAGPESFPGISYTCWLTISWMPTRSRVIRLTK